LNPQLHAPYISSPSHRHLFTTHDRTSAACSAAIPMLCHLPLVQIKWIRCIVLCYVTSFQIDNDANTSSLNFMGPMLFLTPKQQCQRTKGTVSNHKFIGHFTMSHSSPSCSGMAHVNGDHNLLATHKWNEPYLPLLFCQRPSPHWGHDSLPISPRVWGWLGLGGLVTCIQ